MQYTHTFTDMYDYTQHKLSYYPHFLQNNLYISTCGSHKYNKMLYPTTALCYSP